MILGRLQRVIFAAVLLCAPLLTTAQVAVPQLQAHVTDMARALAPPQATALEQKLAAFEARKGSQIAVLILPTTQPETIEQYSIRVAEAWKIGRKGVDDGALLLVAVQDKRVRIEVGRGLEGALPDATAKRIIDEHIVPRFRQGDVNGGIDAGVDRIIRVIDGEPLPSPEESRARGRETFADRIDDHLGWGLMLVIFLGELLRRVFGTFVAALIVGSVGGVIVAWLGASFAISIFVAIAAFVMTLFGISGVGSGRGGGSNGGGWGGGGGTFGGGGASGRW